MNCFQNENIFASRDSGLVSAERAVKGFDPRSGSCSLLRILTPLSGAKIFATLVYSVVARKRSAELSAPKILLAQNGVRFDKWCSAGRSRSFHSRSRAFTTLQLPSTSSPLRAKPFTRSHTRQPIIQTGERRQKVTLFGKFIR